MHPNGINPISDKTDPTLDPESPSFSSKRWVQNMWKLYQSDSEYYKPGKLGVAYKTFEFMVMLLKVIIKQPYRTGIEICQKHFQQI